jgi:uncharacterized protein (DUF1800 family)
MPSSTSSKNSSSSLRKRTKATSQDEATASKKDTNVDGSTSPTASVDSYTKLEKEEDETHQYQEKDVLLPTLGDNNSKNNSNPQATLTTKIDQFLNAYVVYTSSAFQQDKCLKVLQWSAWLLGRYWPSARGGNPPQISKDLQTLYGEVSWARYVCMKIQS